MDLAFWIAIVLAGVMAPALVLYFAWPDVSGQTRQDDKQD